MDKNFHCMSAVTNCQMFNMQHQARVFIDNILLVDETGVPRENHRPDASHLHI
jgi:hypothetical protein